MLHQTHSLHFIAAPAQPCPQPHPRYGPSHRQPPTHGQAILAPPPPYSKLPLGKLSLAPMATVAAATAPLGTTLPFLPMGRHGLPTSHPRATFCPQPHQQCVTMSPPSPKAIAINQ
ncbi:hypothetical protein FKM82_024733 [Ascaphus truei]